MNRISRIKLLKQAQTSTTTGNTTTNSTSTTSTTSQPVSIDLNSIPGFRRDLFNNQPVIVNDIQQIVNILNKYMQILSQNKVNFNIVWNNPSITGSEFSNSLKNLVNLSKWIYSVVKSRTPIYTMEGLRQIAVGLINTVKSYSFPEQQASTVQLELMTVGQNMLAKLG